MRRAPGLFTRAVIAAIEVARRRHITLRPAVFAALRFVYFLWDQKAK
jgi:hypothetical protein